MADAAFIVKGYSEGLTWDDTRILYENLDAPEGYPVEIPARQVRATAFGIISPRGAEKIGYEYGSGSAFGTFVSDVLDDEDREGDGMYEFGGISILVLY